jgi:hypothetical protein
MSGHVFVTRADATALACAAWLLPGNSDDGPGVREAWLTESSGLGAQFDGSRLRAPVPVGEEGRVWRLARDAEDPLAPQPYLLNSGGHLALGPDWYLEGLDAFLSVLRSDAAHWRDAGSRRARPLVGVPMFGTGEGGAALIRGAIVKRALSRLVDAAEDSDLGCDFVLVTFREPDFAAAQWARRQLHGERHLWSALDDGDNGGAKVGGDSELVRVAKDLADKARSGRLVLFLGAGVSAGAGVPMWNELVDDLAIEAGLSAEERATMRERLPVLDQARIVALKLAERDVLVGDAIARHVRTKRASLAHTLLATLPVREVATTNYDELFELASEGAGNPAAQLPYEPDPERQRWVLKLHGTLKRPKDIVLTRDDYLAYHEQRAALAGIVQGLLITKHMLFVGFSFTDDNFYRIVHDVRNALAPSGTDAVPGTFGTAVLLDDDPLRRRLWRNELRFVSTGTSADGDDLLLAARRLEVFLDRLLAEATTTSPHLMNEAYNELLSDDERKLRDAFADFLRAARPEDPSTVPAWTQFSELAHALGFRDP